MPASTLSPAAARSIDWPFLCMPALGRESEVGVFLCTPGVGGCRVHGHEQDVAVLPNVSW